MHNKNLIERARNLRKTQTEAEKILWHAIKNRQIIGYKFRRQYLMAGYIIDFICLERKLIIEADGQQHQLQQEYDQIRTNVFSGAGFRVLRFWNNEIFENLESVLHKIMIFLESGLS